MFARNSWNMAFGSRVAFADLADRQTQWTGDRREFLGRHGRLDRPAALAAHVQLSGRTGAGLDPCCALQTSLELEPGETAEIVFFLGEAASDGDARALLARYRSTDLDAVLRHVTSYWDDVLGTIQVKTPDRSMDIMLNGWMLYQTLSCRMWARSAFYQASGAYGFRDQLQDGMALVVAQPAITRSHLLRAAGRQFPQGDVQHWWLPPTGQGVRTRISDDRIWLAYTATHYLTVTGDLRDPGRSRAVPRRRATGGRRARCLFPTGELRRQRDILRALRPRSRRQSRTRCARAATDRHGRLERRHESRRRARPRRKRLARLVFVRHAGRFRARRQRA